MHRTRIEHGSSDQEVSLSWSAPAKVSIPAASICPRFISSIISSPVNANLPTFTMMVPLLLRNRPATRIPWFLRVAENSCGEDFRRDLFLFHRLDSSDTMGRLHP